jgi:hypothetical protein
MTSSQKLTKNQEEKPRKKQTKNHRLSVLTFTEPRHSSGTNIFAHANIFKSCLADNFFY